MSHKAVLIRGDGTGPELCEAVLKVLDASGAKIEWIDAEAGEKPLKRGEPIVPDRTIELIKQYKVALKGPMTTPIGKGSVSANVTLRKKLDLFACMRPVWELPGVPTPFKNLNIVIFRENTEDLYAQVEYYNTPDVAISLKIISRPGSRRILEFAFEWARANKRKKVAAVHKANIMKISDGLFLQTAREVAQKYPDIEFSDYIVDNMCMQLVTRWQNFDVLVLPNLYGDIISDLAAGMMGGLGVAPGANFGRDCAVFEAVHGSAPKYAGLNKVNPTALLLSAVLMLRHLKETKAADRIEQALYKVLQEGKIRTYDLGGTAGTQEFAQAIVANMS
ncbi:Isocitrate dehydrogenase [NADP] [bacterium HR07]|uniref:Isocitrate dehydrogenase (NAD(+)) n=2 Tax=Candidatus Bipolaricaulota TaxID=67810 RepID=H5SPV9_9BACT|nr:isocitrate dehydrogenase (NAD(+)) [uncultured Acetothermia bacterium]BAL58195.1 isocitrate dehydrogenase (NAD(+)) [uncultured Acetothermia bacterium]BAL59893.1 isocitrate dehydrogenase (NAD(+)) [Candidatus Acetothermum autotrophicum]GBC76502.1 Isocitrate dehydrogenase [NADP] [bacterium HR07]